MKFFLPILFVCFHFLNYSQVNAVVPKDTIKEKEKAFNAGDIVVNANYGLPQVSAAAVRTAIKIYYRLADNETMSFSVTNSGVYNAKAEYGIMQTLGIGVAVSYWDMNINMQNNYTTNGNVYTDDLALKWTVLGLGVRGNYHLVEDIDNKIIDPYFGFTIGMTKYTKDLVYSSTNPNRQIPEEIPPRLYELKDGWASYVSSTFGIRIYPVKYVGINIEAGWDKGALLFGGIVFKIPTKAVKAFEE